MKRILILATLLLALLSAGHSLPAGRASELTPVSAPSVTDGRPDVKVWVNTASGVYHCPGTRWYGNTKRGEYMTQKQAQDKKYRPAYGKYCD
jgi:hypothetical protein